MSFTESQIQSLILRDLTADPRCRLFRNNVAQSWTGSLIQRNPDGSVLLAHARPLHAGLCVGSGDLIGWLGPRFLSIEVKSATGRPSPEQLIWLNNVRTAGGIAAIVSSVDEARAALRP